MNAAHTRFRVTRVTFFNGIALVLALTSLTCRADSDAPQDSIKSGSQLFIENCSFCHGRDAKGGDGGPDLAGSPLVQTDPTGEKIASVLREGRFGTAMPSFNFSSDAVASIVAFLHAQTTSKTIQEGDRGSVKATDLRTGHARAGEIFFRGAGQCTTCHSATGDLAGIASRYQGLQLLLRMLNPPHPTRAVTVSVGSEHLRGNLEYLDEFTIGMRDQSGSYHSWQRSDVTYQLDQPLTAHSELLQRYSDTTMHDLHAYLETLK